MKILITGATGLIGRELGKELVRRGHEVFVVSRDKRKAALKCPFPCRVIEADLTKTAPPLDALKDVEAVVHLMGESIAAGRWTAAKKKTLITSRVDSLRNLKQSLPSSLRVLVSSSAIGFYGDRGEDVLTETSPVGEGFSADLCRQWEAEATSAGNARTVSLRMGVVLAHNGGALPAMKTPIRWGVGGALGSGRQWLSWIHLRDAVRMYVWALEADTVHGPVNAVSPHPERQGSFSEMIARILGKPHRMPVPSVALKAMLGEKATLLLDSQRIVPSVATGSGFTFEFGNLRDALRDLLKDETDGFEVFETEQYIPAPREDVFPFFARASNLGEITPESLQFEILNGASAEVQEGALIDYRLRVRGVPVRWQTKIEQWDPPHRFVDTQLKGPYETWHHTHTFESLGPGTLMTDRVLYRLPLGALGRLSGGWLVEHDVRGIFDFRRRKINQIFGPKSSPSLAWEERAH